MKMSMELWVKSENARIASAVFDNAPVPRVGERLHISYKGGERTFTIDDVVWHLDMDGGTITHLQLWVEPE